MKLYKVTISPTTFEYEYLTDTCHIQMLNKIISELDLPLLGSNDSTLIKSVGGTIISYDRIDKDKKYYIIDLDYIRGPINISYNGELYERFKNLRDSIKRDMSIINIVE